MATFIFRFSMGRATVEISLDSLNRFEAYKKALETLPQYVAFPASWTMTQFARQDATGLTRFPIPC